MTDTFFANHNPHFSNSIGCPHLSVCSGCEKDDPVVPVSPLFIRAQKFIKEISKGTIELQLQIGQSRGWRTRAKLACQNIKGTIKFGLYKKASHTLLAIPFCQVHHPSINKAIQLLESHFTHLAQKTGQLLAYNEISHTGLIRYVQCSVERKSGKVQVGLVLNIASTLFESEHTHKEYTLILKTVENMHSERPDVWHSFWVNANNKKTNTIMGEAWKKIVGEEFVWEKICTKQIPYKPSHFEQANLEMFERVLLDIQRICSKDDVCIELYAGMGVIGLCLQDHIKTSVAIESSKGAISSFEEAKKQVCKEAKDNLFFIEGDCEEVYIFETYHQYDSHTLLVDPPRKGLSQKLIHFLCQKDSVNIQKLIYISCHYLSLERDIQVLVESGLWAAQKAESYLFFPGTDHIETVMVLTKKYSPLL